MWRLGRLFRSAALLLLLLQPLQAGAETLLHGQGLLWKIEREGKPIAHLFGTIHLSDPKILDLPRPVARAFRAAQSLSIEVILDDGAMQRIGAAMMLPQEQRLQDIVPPDLFQQAAAAAEPLGLQPVHLSRLKPWAVAMLISAPANEVKNRGTGKPALDVWLMERARERNKPVYGLETLAEQVGAFDAMSAEDQVVHLRSAIIPLAEKERMLAAMKDAYLRRDLDGLLRASRQEEKAGDRAMRERVERRLLDDRNSRMVERMLPRFDEGGAFIAIGAAHLPGEAGVLALLESRGYVVRRAY